MNLLADQMMERLKEQNIKADKEKIIQFLEMLKEAENKPPEEKEQFLNDMAKKFYNFGMTAYKAQSKANLATHALSKGLTGGTVQMTGVILN